MTVEFVDLPDELLVLMVQVLNVVALTVAHVGETLLRFHLLSLQAVDLTLGALTNKFKIFQYYCKFYDDWIYVVDFNS